MSSSRNIANHKTSVVAANPFCKVCSDAGKSEKEYTSHFVKDQPGRDGKVVCPTLLNQACRICHNTGHTSSYCSQYRSRRDYREEPRREEPRREDYRRDREYREEQRYIAREEPRRGSYDRLRDDTERHERDLRERDEQYQREQERRSKPWLQAALKRQEPEERQHRRREPYAHPHGPRARLILEATALCASKHAVEPEAAAAEKEMPAIDVRKVNLNHASKWEDEDTEKQFVCDPEQMTAEFFQDFIMSNLTSSKEHEVIEMCDDQSQMPFECGE